MIEVVRFLLSCVVLESHMWLPSTSWLAWQSVFGFYTLSGFLMVRVLRERYGFGLQNFTPFMVNRFLRLWPAYLVVLALTGIALRMLDVEGIYPLLHRPYGQWDALANITVLGLVGVSWTREAAMTLMVPNSWSLSIEMFCYILLSLYFGKSQLRLLALGLIGVVMLSWSTGECLTNTSFGYGPYCFQNRYGVLQAGFIPFAIGGLLQFHMTQLAASFRRWWLWLGLACLAVEGLIALVPALQYTAGPFFGSVMVAGIVAFSVGRGRGSRLTDFVGRASYHLFIAQWVIAAVLVRMTPLTTNSLALCIATLLVSLMLSGLLVPLEHHVERIRRDLRPSIGAHAPEIIPAADRVVG